MKQKEQLLMLMPPRCIECGKELSKEELSLFRLMHNMGSACLECTKDSCISYWNDGCGNCKYPKCRLYPQRLTNFYKKERPIYEKAIEIYSGKAGSNGLHIRDDAYDINGKQLSDSYNALIGINIGYSRFWQVYDKLVEEMKTDVR
jgi:hypothetical protein